MRKEVRIGKVGGWEEGWMGGRMDGGKDGWEEGWMGGRMDGRKDG